MSILKHLEENAEHLLDLVEHMIQVQLSMHGVVNEDTQKIRDVLEAHVNSTETVSSPATVDVVVDNTPAPVIVDAAPLSKETVVVEPSIVS
jgi:hypothetical protein